MPTLTRSPLTRGLKPSRLATSELAATTRIQRTSLRDFLKVCVCGGAKLTKTRAAYLLPGAAISAYQFVMST